MRLKMTYHPKKLSAALMLATAVFGSNVYADATINGDTTGATTWNRLFQIGSGTPVLSGVGTNTPFQAFQIRITNVAAFVAETTSAAFDTTLTLYQGSFSSTDQFTNFTAYDDDGGSGLLSRIGNDTDGPLTEDNYTIVVSGFGNGSFGTYVLQLLGAILGWGPVASEQLDEVLAVMSDTARNNLRQTGGTIRDAAQNSFASRDATVLSTKDMASLLGNVYVWAKASTLYQRESNLGRKYNAPLLQFGADVGVGDNIVAGLSVGLGDLTVKSADFNFEGSQTLIQPYLSWRQGDWHGDAMVTYGMIDYDTITTLSGTAAAEGEMLAFSAEVGRDFALPNKASTYLTPFVGVDVGEVELTATSGTLAGVGLGSNVSFSELSLGARLTHDFQGGSFVFELSADHWDTDAPTGLFGGAHDTNGWSGTASFDLQTQLSSNTTLGTGIQFGGIGTNNVSYVGSVSLAIQF